MQRLGPLRSTWLGGLSALVVLVLSAAVAWAVHAQVRQQTLDRLDDTAMRQLDLYAAALDGELAKHAYLPSMLEVDPQVLAVLAPESGAAPTPAQREALSRTLAGVNVRASAMSLFVVDRRGQVLASSDWYLPDSRYGHRWHDQAELPETSGPQVFQHFDRHPRNGTGEFYFLHPVHDGALRGWIGVRLSLGPLEATWRDLSLRPGSEKVLVADRQGVVVMASDPAWTGRSLAPLADRDPGGTALDLRKVDPLAHGARLVTLGRSTYFVQERGWGRLGWRMWVLADPTDALRTPRLAAAGSAALCALLCWLILHILQRRRDLRHLLQARQALQASNQALEDKVRLRTHELQSANASLHQEIVERERAQAELVQAGKLAALGQMSATVSHEIGQPLTALRALALNTRTLLDRGLTATAFENLARIGEITERIARIAAQLRTFARKSPPLSQSVDLNPVLARLQSMIADRVDGEGVTLHWPPAITTRVVCDAHRLEQVLLNLLLNALDAMQDAPDDGREKVLTLSTKVRGDRLQLQVSDTGAGVAPEALPHLFEPFFTTKASGVGLGLVISSHIVQEFGGSLRVGPGAQEVGASFEFDLALASRAPGTEPSNHTDKDEKEPEDV